MDHNKFIDLRQFNSGEFPRNEVSLDSDSPNENQLVLDSLINQLMTQSGDQRPGTIQHTEVQNPGAFILPATEMNNQAYMAHQGGLSGLLQAHAGHSTGQTVTWSNQAVSSSFVSGSGTTTTNFPVQTTKTEVQITPGGLKHGLPSCSAASGSGAPSDKRRRALIKTGYETLGNLCAQAAVESSPENSQASSKNSSKQSSMRGNRSGESSIPTSNPITAANSRSTKSQAAILHQTSDYIDHLQDDIKALKEEQKRIQVQIQAVETMKQTYLSMATKSTSQVGSKPNVAEVTEQEAFSVFTSIMSRLYDKFKSYVSLQSFPLLTETMLKFAELYCNPSGLHQAAANALQRSRAWYTGRSLFGSS